MPSPVFAVICETGEVFILPEDPDPGNGTAGIQQKSRVSGH